MEIAPTQYYLGRMLQSKGDDDEAARALEKTRELFAEMGMELWGRRARDALGVKE